MLGITDVLNMKIFKCITNGRLIGIMIIKGRNSGRNKKLMIKATFEVTYA